MVKRPYLSAIKKGETAVLPCGCIYSLSDDGQKLAQIFVTLKCLRYHHARGEK